MCGIGGIRRFGDTPILREELITLLCCLERRGNHATGIALADSNGVYVHKAATPAWAFTKSHDFDEFLKAHLTDETETAILHTRWATVGTPADNENNHPIWDGETAIVHNGGISNYDHLFRENKFEKSCATDSDIIRAILAQHGFTEKAVRELNKMSGSAAIACVSSKEPGKLLLARSGSPLVYGFGRSVDKMYFASEPEGIIKASKVWRWIHGVPVKDRTSDLSLATMQNDSAWLFNNENLEWHAQFKTCYHYNAPNYSSLNTSYHTKTKGWKKQQREKKAADEAAASKDDKEGKEQPKEQEETPPKVVVISERTEKLDPKVLSKLETPLKNSVIMCPGCGTPNKNVDGIPWELTSCDTCGTGMTAE